MQVEIVKSLPNGKFEAWDVLACGTNKAEFREWTNPVSNKPDP